uniref:Okadaic acid binding protein 2.3 n=1 Tax=Halichondria okadai TaxID=163232 RepID=B0M1D1_HALOK|nr:okadaic acid binding protein 2.3 [Halichondria okadai]
MAVSGEPSKHWCRKIRSMFRQWDVEAGLKGYVTEEDFKNRVGKTLERFPELASSKDKLIERAHHHWVEHCNLGVKMPPGYRLTEAQYIQNFWLFIHSPKFDQYLKEASQIIWDGLDKEKKGFLTKEEAHAHGIRVTNDKDHASRGIFETMDEKKSGRITFEDTIKAQRFFFTDQNDESHPFNHIRGPLVD